MCAPTASAPVEESRGPVSLPPEVPLPRGLLQAAALWVALSFIWAFGLNPPISPSAASFEPPARMLVLLCVVGGLICWPLGRLCGTPPARPLAAALLDALTLAAVLQCVLWPIRLVTDWPRGMVLGIDAILLAHLALTAGILGALRRWPTLAMAAAILGAAVAIVACRLASLSLGR